MIPQGIQQPMDWRQALRSARKNRQMTQAELAHRSGLSPAAIKAYESGGRHPKGDNLKCLLDALGLPLEEANRILAAAGYAADADAIFNAGFEVMDIAALAARADACPWTAYITNRSYDVVYANKHMARLFDVDLSQDLLGSGERNLLGGITHEVMASRVGNWDELVAFMIGLAKGDPRWSPDDPSRPAPWLQFPMQKFLEGNPVRVKRFFELWESTSPLPHYLVQRYRMVWLYGGATRMNFHGLLHVANLSDELHWNEWIPADHETWLRTKELADPVSQDGAQSGAADPAYTSPGQ